MKSESRINNMISRKTVGILLAILLLCILTPVVYAANNKATTIRLAKTEGQVTVQNSEKGELIQTENMRLYSGDHELTGAASYAWMNLDDAKAIKLDELSETELRKKWRKLEVMLDSGSVFFNVTVPLEDDEALNIRSSTMVTGIRGTCGWVRILDGETTRVYLLEGELECVVTNPVEGSTKTITLKPGEYADFCVYDPDEAVGDTCEIIPHRFDREDIEPYVLVELLGDMPLINKIYDQSGIDLRNLTSQEVSEALAQKQAENLRKFQAVQLEANAQDAVISKDPVWSPVAKIADGQQVAQNGENGQGEEPGQAEEDRPKTRDDIPFKTPNSITTVTTPTTPPQMSVNEKTQENDAEDEEEDEADNTGEDTPAAEETPVTDDTIIYLTMPQTATTVQGYLDQEKVKQVVLLPGTGSVDDNTLKVDIDFNTPVDKTLTARAAVPVNVLSGNSFTVNGTADLQDTLTNNGTVTVVSANTLRVVKRFLNHGILDNTETGRIVLSAGLSSDGAFLTAGLVEAAEGVTGDALITIDGGSFTITAGKIVSDQFDTIIEIQSGASVTLNLSGGSVSNDKEGGATLEVSTGDFHIAALGTDIMGITDNLLGADTDLAQYEAASVWLKDERYHLVALASVDSYPVVVSGDIEHGTIEVPARVEAGASVPLTITPDDGYELETVTVNLYDTDGGIGAAVAVAEDYTFEMPRSNVIVGGSFKKIIVAHDVTVIKTDATQGAVISSTPAAKPGETVTLTITPEAGYEIDTVTVTDADGNDVELTQTENGYSFVMPEGEVKVNTTFRKLKYTITWTNEDGTTMETDADVEYGDMPVYNGETPMKPATAQYTYTFTGWTQTVEAATKDVTYVAAFAETLNTYAVTWKDEDGTVLRTDPAVAYGTAPVYGGEAAPGKAGMAQYSYTFAGWQSGDSLYAADQALPAVTGAVSYTAVYTQTVNRYAVTFVDEDGETVLQAAALYDYGTKADQVAQPKAPAKTADAQYTYAFAGWRLGDILYTGDAVLPDVTEDMTYTAVYHTTLNTYTVTWKNEDGTVLETDTDVAYGSVPSYDGETPAKTADAQYSYTFLGWTPAITNVTGNVTYVATYTNTTKAYTVTWKNEDGTVLETDEAVRYGETPSYDGATPTKTADAQYTYTFAAWTPEVNPVTGNVTYTASYASEVNKYNITFVDEDGETVLKAALGYEYGTKSAKIAQPATPVKAATAQYSYTFAGWKVNDTIYAAGGALPDVTEDVVYRAVYDSSVNTYTVIWKHEDGMVLETDEDVAYGDTPAYNGSTPVKTATKQYSYTFSGWSAEEAQYTGDAVLPVVTGNVTYTTVFDSAVNQYTVTFVDEDGVTVLKPAVSYDYGTKSAEIIQPDTPKKTATAQYTYTFVGWEQGETTYAAGAAGVALPDVTENVVYRAVYDSSVNTYIVTWKNADGTVLETDENVAYGEAPAYDGDTPVQTSTAQYTYTFAGWKLDSTIYGGDTAMPAVTGNVTYTAAYDSTVNTYTVTWKNADGTVLEIDENVPYGSTPSYDGATPAKDADAQYTYTFLGWDTAITNVISDVTYVATYTNITNAYKVIWQNEDGTVLETDRDVLYGATPVYNGETPTKAATAQYTYTFAAWTPEVNPVTGNVTYTASYTSEVNQYNITFVDEDGSTVLKAAATYDYGTESAKIAQPATPVKTATAQYTYTFAGWKVNDTTYAVGQALPDVTANAVYQATYSAATNAYTVTWKNADGTVLKTDLNVLYGTVPSYEGTTPVKPADAQYTYTFAGWSAAGTDHAAGEALPSVTGDVTFTAAFSNTVNQYSVTFVDEDGTTVLKAAVGYDYGTAAADIVKPADPTKATDARYTYKFSGWTPEITDVTTDAVYKATYSSTVNQYNVTFVDEDGKTILKAAVGYDYGTAAADIVKPTDPAKEADAQYTYKFAGWSPALAEVTGAAVYTATYSSTVNTYTVTWKNDNGDVLETDEDVPYNSVPSYDGATPVKEADAQYTYTFLGWDTAITNVTGNITYTATYTNTTNAYTVTWKDEDGSVLETDENVLYGETPTYDGATPTKEATAQYTYTFAAWTPSVNTVTGDVTYTASYTSEVNQYNVTFVDEDGRTVLKAATAYDYGTAAADIVKPADPTKDSTEQYTYKFSGWTPAVAEVTGAASYTATYTAVPRTYAVTLNLNAGADTSAAINAGSVTEYTYGTGATLPTDVTRTGYTFDGWYTTADSTDSGTKVTAIGSGETGDKTFYARWKINTYNVIWKNADIDNTTLRTDSDVEYGTVPSYGAATDPAKTATAQYTYTFSGWTDGTANYAVGAALPAVTADVTYTAVYTPVLREYTITFYGDGADLPLHTQDVKYGETPVYNGTTPVKASTVSTDYTFAGWQNESGDATELMPVEGIASYYARFTESARNYTITFYAEDGTTVLGTQQVAYDTVPVYAGSAPTKAQDAQYTYAFDGWAATGLMDLNIYVDLPKVTGDVSYKAHFAQTARTYSVTLNLNAGEDAGAKINSGNVTEYTYGIGATLPTDVTRAGYEFKGWYEVSAPSTEDSQIRAIGNTETGDKTYYASWTPNPISGTIILTNSGTKLMVGETITASVTYTDGADNAGTLTYTWKRGDTVLTDETTASYTLVTADIGNKITCEIESSIETGKLTKSTETAVVERTFALSLGCANTDYGYIVATTSSGTTIENCTAASDAEVSGEVKPGDTVTLTLTCGKRDTTDYNDTVLNSFTVNGEAKNVTETNDQYVYSFTMPDEEVSVEAVFVTNDGYTASAVAATNGSVKLSTATNSASASLSGMKHNAAVTVTVTPEAGYELGTITVTRTHDTAWILLDSNEVALTTVTAGGEYTFTMPADPVNVAATFKPIDYEVMIDADKITNGTVTADQTTGLHVGDTVTLTTTSEAGYELETLSVALEDGTAVTHTPATSVAEATYTFTMPAGNVEVSAAFSKIVAGLYGAEGSIIKSWNRLLADGLVTVSGTKLTAVDHSLAGKLVLPVDIISINESTFQDCVSLTEIELTGVTALPSGGTSPFKGCSALKRLSMTKLATIPASTFANTTITSLETIELGEGLTSIGNEAFLGRESLKSIVIPDSVTSIGNYAFSGCKGLTTVTLGSGLKTIGKQAFLYCQSLEALVIPDSVTSLGSEQTFGFCTGLKSVTIGTGLTSLPQYAFDGCSSLEGTLVIPQNITSIGKGAFEGCEKLTGLTLSANLTSIGTLAFYNCKNIEGTITVPAGVTALSESQFKNCAKITSVKLPGIKTLSCSSGDSSNSPFGGCTALTSVEFGPDLTSIGAYVFNGRTSLTDVTFAGSEKKWADVTKGDYNTPLTSATKHFTAYLVNDGITNATAAATALEDWVEDENCYKPGASVTLTITPASGYTMTAGSLTLTDAAGNAITYEASASSDLVVTFTMPDSPVTVEAVFEETSSSYFSIGTAAHSNYDYYDYNSSSTIVVPGGTVVTDKTSAKAGETVKVTVTPDRGYVLNNMEISYYSEDSVIAETSRNILYSLVEGETTVYQFVVPSDVESTGWYAADIMVVANFEGTGNEVSCQYNTDYLSVTATAPSGFDNPKPSAPTISGRVNVVAGDEVTLNVTPGAGFAVDAITVTGSSGAPYEMTSPKEGTYVFTMPDEAVVVNTTTKLASADGKVTLPVSTDLSLIRKYLAVNGLRELVLTGTDDQELLELGSALEIPAGVTLTVGDGCILLVRDSAGILTVNGTLKTEGTGKVWLYGRAKLNAADGVVTGTVLYTSSATLTGEAESAILCAAIGSDSNGHVYYAVYDLEGGTYSALEVAATGAMPDTWWNFAPRISSHYSNSGCSVPWKACMTGGTKVKSLTLHKGITHIGKYAFYGLYYLEEVEVPSTVTEIADGAFKNCIVLKTIKLPEGLQSIGANAFLIEKEVTVTTEVNLPSTLVSIGNRAFYHRELLNVVIPKTLTDYNYGLYDYGDSYGYDACFSGAYLKDVSFESGTTAIPEGAFINVGYYKQLTFTIPVTVTEIGERPFGSSAPIIYYEGTKAQWLELIGSDTDLNATIIFTNNNLALASDLYGWDKIIGAGITQVEIIKSCSVSDSITVKSGMVMTIAEGVEAGIYASGDDCFTIEEGATIENRGKVTNAYNLLNNGTFNNYGTMINGGGDYSPRFTNSGTFNNSGTMTNEYGGEFTNSGILKNSATVTNDNGGTFNNNGTFTNSGTFTNNGTYTGSEVVVPVP